MNQLSIEDKAMLEKMDNDLIELEDSIKGYQGDIITQMRGLIERLVFNE